MASKKGTKAVWGFKRRTALTVFTQRLPRKEGESYLQLVARGKAEYKALSPLEKRKLATEAAAPALPRTFQETKKHLKNLVKQLIKAGRVLKQIGVAYYFEVQLDNISHTLAHDNILRHVLAERPYQAVSFKNTHLRNSVQKIFNDAYGRALGKEESNLTFPYKKHSLVPVVNVTGMPEGVEFKHPSSYGALKLQQIINNKTLIKMELIAPSFMAPNPASQVVQTTMVQDIVAKEPSLGAAEVVQTPVVMDIFMAPDPASQVVQTTMVQDIVAKEPSLGAAEVVQTPVVMDMEEAPTSTLQLSTVKKNYSKQHQESGKEKQRKGLRTLWTAAEVLVVQQHFSQELAGLKPVTRINIDSFLAQQTGVKRTYTAVQNYLLRNRKKNRPNDQ